MTDMTSPRVGGCRCGQLRFRLTKAPILTGACHCTGCQKMTGGPYSLTLTVPGDGFEITEGTPVIGGLHGPVAHHYHCDFCKSWVFTRAEGMDWFVNVRPTMLDEPGDFTPFIELWTAEKLPWATTPARHSFAGPATLEDFQSLMTEFAAPPG